MGNHHRINSTSIKEQINNFVQLEIFHHPKNFEFCIISTGNWWIPRLGFQLCLDLQLAALILHKRCMLCPGLLPFTHTLLQTRRALCFVHKESFTHWCHFKLFRDFSSDFGSDYSLCFHSRVWRGSCTCSCCGCSCYVCCQILMFI